MFITVVYLNIANGVSGKSTNIEPATQKRFFPAFFGRFGTDPNYLLTNRAYYDDDFGKDVIFHKKRQLKKKWTKFLQGSQSPYTIAFPALIRTR